MIESIHIENFQAHKSLEINLEQVTTLVGPTDAGKSSVIRFLRWAMLNESAGDITTWGEDHTHGKLLVDGRKVERRKGKRENCYQVDGGTPHDAVGKSVPPDVAALLNVGDVNFQGQLDSHFWLADTPGEVSRQLNAVVDLSAMDELTSAMASDVSSLTASVRARKESLDIAKAKRDELKWVDQAGIEFADVEHAGSVAFRIRARIDSLAKAVQKGMDARQITSDALELAVRGRERLSDAWDWFIEARNTTDKAHWVVVLATKIKEIEEKKSIIEESKMGTETMRRRAEDAGAWMEAVDTLKKKSDEYQRIDKLVRSARLAGDIASACKKDLIQASSLLTEMMGGNCPLCGAEMEGDKCRT